MRARTERTVNLPRQLLAYTGIGALQWLIDTAVMIASSQLGLQVGLATVAGRLSGAAIGYALNGRYTFAHGAGGNRLHSTRLRRFITFWLLATALSALLLAGIDRYLGLHASWLCKPLVDIGFAATGFIAARHWIYRDHRPG